MAVDAGVSYIAAIGIQHLTADVQLARDVAELDSYLMASGMRHCTMRVPMFLENLLYQARNVKQHSQFSFPCDPDSLFSYIACQDLAPVVAGMLIRRRVYEDTRWTAERQTSCREVAGTLSRLLNKLINYVSISDDAFISQVVSDGGSASSEVAASGILQLWKLIEQGRDLPPNSVYRDTVGRPPQDVEEWLTDHVCCFSDKWSCPHPQPPAQH
jgi:hypothetical protein